MIERLATERKSYIDIEVLQRLIKRVDFLILGLGALTLTLGMARPSAADASDPRIGFFSFELTLLCILALRSLGLYDISFLRNALKSIVLSIATALAVGALNYLIAQFGLLDLEPQWLLAWIILISLHFTATRGIIALWATPLDRAGRFRKRVAIVGGGRAAEHSHTRVLTRPQDRDCRPLR